MNNNKMNMMNRRGERDDDEDSLLRDTILQAIYQEEEYDRIHQMDPPSSSRVQERLLQQERLA
eukprot:CAMPEP_0119568700 /NCGR_PEP_ID=MMETSP1352-20130426/39613_1 /TAXON_ID=265584 /ORGANISM="Stauroneis constricta, Strain CCMP1120" /LENGTH=62 /DNA_ID=CAMNT_0007618145 /DNA_START=17 /DNA_END=201 /DNA_ORIENTATION=-